MTMILWLGFPIGKIIISKNCNCRFGLEFSAAALKTMVSIVKKF